MIRNVLLATAVIGFAATDREARPRDRRHMAGADGDTGRILYDDGYDDLFCVRRTRLVGYDWWGRPIFRRATRCRRGRGCPFRSGARLPRRAPRR
ncbi:hypothetical protein QNA08_09315 [Chelatococcus sp. SYSU_G07232]|uniref:Secreted protein n=1 Tax=Chelatococcus albus TaxID=3047466 RepID=A0ABT7AGE8_9HYPH|nr:hypothetical protein [Chelatococcus sp. SYSU_G07232]MDJ1158431.1 hypothetical protein [Chelatococcus sp. SYSU_G07232]